MRRALVVLLICGLLYLQFVLWVGKGGVRDVRDMREKIAQEQAEITTLKERNLGLAAEVLDLKEGLDAIEERARSEMGMVKEDEVFYQIIAPPGEGEGSPVVEHDLKLNDGLEPSQ